MSSSWAGNSIRNCVLQMPWSLDERKHGSILFSCQVELFFPLWWFKGKGRRRSHKSWHLLFLSLSGKPHMCHCSVGIPRPQSGRLFKSIGFILRQVPLGDLGNWHFYSLSCTVSCSGLKISRQLSSSIFSSFLLPWWFSVWPHCSQFLIGSFKK